MPRVFTRVCLDDHELEDPNTGVKFTLIRGKVYTTSQLLPDNTVNVFTQYWFNAPAEWFAGEKPL